MEPESSSPYSQVPAICPYPKPTPSSLHPQPTSRRSILIYPTKCPFSCCVIPPLETLPPRDPSGRVVYLRIVLSPEEATKVSFSRGGVVSTSPNPQAGGPTLVGSPRLLIQYIRIYPPYRRQFLYPQPEDAPCRGDRDPLQGHLDIIKISLFVHQQCNIQTPIRTQYLQPHHHRINQTPMYFNGLFWLLPC